MSDRYARERYEAVMLAHVRLLGAIFELDSEEIERLYRRYFTSDGQRRGSVGDTLSQQSSNQDHQSNGHVDPSATSPRGAGMLGEPKVYTLPDDLGGKSFLFGSRARKRKGKA